MVMLRLSRRAMLADCHMPEGPVVVSWMVKWTFLEMSSTQLTSSPRLLKHRR